MKVFISWSKRLSKDCAELLRDWIKCTLQASEPWVSSKDIDKGSLWFNQINDQLKDTKVGIVCLTKENKDNPWILFESGALAKGLSANRVCTFLIDLTPADLANPMAQFNHTMPDKDGMKSLLATINKELGENALEDRILDQVFETYWPQFEEKFNVSVSDKSDFPEIQTERSQQDILTEILYTTRTLDKRIRNLEQKRVRTIWNSQNILLGDNENVIRYKIKVDPDMVAQDIKSVLSELVEADKVSIKEHSSDTFYVIVPDLGEKGNMKVRDILESINKN